MQTIKRVPGRLAVLALADAAGASTLTTGGSYGGRSHIDENHSSATLNNIILDNSTLAGTNFRQTNFTGANMTRATYDASTILPSGISAAQLASMTFVAEPSTALMLFAGLGGLAFYARPRKSAATKA